MAVVLSALPAAAPAGAKPEPLSIVISAKEGEHSRDSNSTTTAITLSGNEIHYRKSYTGYRAGRRAPIDKRVQVRDEDLDLLQKLLVDNDLLRSRSSASPTDQPGSYVEIDATITSRKNSSTLKFSAMRENAERDSLYSGLRALLDAIEQIVNP